MAGEILLGLVVLAAALALINAVRTSPWKPRRDKPRKPYYERHN